jgi:FKBP-type peptidyl-prolyl cis-trans isomerase FkpA
MDRKNAYALLLLAAALGGGCQKPAGAPAASPAPSAAALSEDERTIYALGAMIGQRFAGPMRLTDKEVEILQRGVKATARGGQPEFPIEGYAEKFDALARSRAAVDAAGNKAQASAFRDQAAAEPGAVKLASGLVYKTLTPGKGPSPKATDVVRVHYHGTLPDGKVFDSSVARGQPAEFGLNQVIACWSEGVQRMKVGEKAKLVCPSEIAYGDGGTPDGTIPPGATLVFEVELIAIKGR